jgi:HK97 family phage major capsid protein
MTDQIDVNKEIEDLAKNVKSTHETLNRTFEEFKKTQEQAHSEFAKKGDIDPLLENMREKMAEDMAKQQEAIDEAIVKMNRPRLGTDSYDDKDAEYRNARKFFTEVETKRGNLHGAQIITDDQVDMDAYAAYKSVIGKFLRAADDRKLTAEEYKALSVGSDPDGGYTVTPEMSNMIIERRFESSPLRQVATVETISSSSLEILEDPEEFSASRTSETSSTGNTTTAQLGKREIVAHIIEARPRATQTLLDDSSIDIEAWISQKIANKFARVEASEFITGDGVGKARGITTYTAGTDWGEIEQIDSGANGSATYAQLATISTSLKENYYANAQWLLHRTLIGKILGLSGNDTPLWIPSIATGQPSTLLGYPVRFAQDFATPATNSLSGAFGDFRAGYTWVDRIGIRIQPDPYSAKPFVEFYGTTRSGGAVTNFDAIKIIKLAA